MPIHTMQNGEEIRISDMSDSHLRNTIALIKRRAEEGVKVEYGYLWPSPYYDFDILYGEDAEDHLGLQDYLNELEKRGLR